MSFGAIAASYITLAPSGQTYSIFDGQPSVSWEAENVSGGICLGTEFRVTQDAWVTHIRYLAGNDALRPDASYCTLWEMTDDGNTATMLFTPLEMPIQTQLGEWVTMQLPAPVRARSGDVRYMVVVWHPSGWHSYIITAGYFQTGEYDGQNVTKGPLVISYIGDSWHQGTYQYTSQHDVFPVNGYNGSAYYSDIIITT